MQWLLYLDILWNTGVKRCKKFSCMSLKTFFPSTVCANLFSVTEHSLPRAVFKLRTCRLPGVEPIPEGVQGTSGHGTLGSGLVQKVGITHRLDSMALNDFPTSMNMYVSYFCFWKCSFFFLSVYMILQWLSRLKKNYFAFLLHHKDTKFISTIIIS